MNATVKYLRTLLLPSVLVLVNFLVIAVVASRILPTKVATALDILVVYLIIIYAGALVISRLGGSLWKAMLAGVIISLFNYVLLHGVWVISYLIQNKSSFDDISLTLRGILFSYYIFIPVYMLLGFVGGWLVRKIKKGE